MATVKSITYSSGTKAITAWLYTPDAGAGTTGGIVIAYGADGFTNNLNGPWKKMLEGYANDLADKGFVVLIPDYLDKTSTSPGIEALGSILLVADQWVEALKDGIDHLKGLSKVDGSRIGLLGFSLGGYLLLKLRVEAKLIVEYFAPRFLGIGAGGGPGLKAQIHHGTADQLPATKFDPVALQIKSDLEAEGTVVELFSYSGANHGFIGGDSDNTKARTVAKEKTLLFFETNL